MTQPEVPSETLLARLRQRFVQHRYRQIYCNRDLVSSRARWIGFDMDYTLAIYRREAFDELVHRLALDRLVHTRDYPPELLAIPFDPHFAIRGLVMDKANGHILKMDAHAYVGKGYHGLRPLERHELDEYRRHPPHIGNRRFALVDTLFEMPECYLYASIVDLLETRGLPCPFSRIADEIRAVVDLLHADGSLKDEVMRDPDRYLFRDPELRATLQHLRDSGKGLFLMTNSFAEYTQAVMTFLLGDGRNGTDDWRDLFEIAITGAMKPAFFRHQAPFMTLDDQYRPLDEEHLELRPGQLYQGGNLAELERFLGLAGDEIVYVGDHIYGDILRSKRDSAWRTVMIIPEMEEELHSFHRIQETVRMRDAQERQLRQLADRLSWEADMLDRLQGPGREIVLPSLDLSLPVQDIQALLHQSRQDLLQHYHDMLTQCRALERNIDGHFHPRWGSLFKEGNEHSLFGSQVESYACLYTSRVSNLLAYAPTHYFRSPPDYLPHEFL
jgi:HAD superfamily 5'-nucleotidase-like hydrolase